MGGTDLWLVSSPLLYSEQPYRADLCHGSGNQKCLEVQHIPLSLSLSFVWTFIWCFRWTLLTNSTPHFSQMGYFYMGKLKWIRSPCKNWPYTGRTGKIWQIWTSPYWQLYWSRSLQYGENNKNDNWENWSIVFPNINVEI